MAVLPVVVLPVPADLSVVLFLELVDLLFSEEAVAVVPVVVMVPVPADLSVVLFLELLDLLFSEEAVAVVPVVMLPVPADWAVVLSI